MAGVALDQRMTAMEYLAWERLQASKHEYDRGEVLAMAGGSPRHNFLSIAAAAELRAAMRGGPCHVLSSDQRISATPGEKYVYADAVVACGELEMESGTTDVLANPSLIVEVLSRSTESHDRGGKWEAYQRLPSLTDYLLVGQSSVRVEHFQREADGSWRYRVLGPGEAVALASGAIVRVDDVYRGAFDLAAS
jgi:Uma2 family endonuclease